MQDTVVTLGYHNYYCRTKRGVASSYERTFMSNFKDKSYVILSYLNVMLFNFNFFT